MNTATIIPILAFIGITSTILYQAVQYLKYKKKHKKPNIPTLRQNAYVVDPKKFIENIDKHTHVEKVSITKNKQKLKMAYYAIVSIFIVFVGAVVLLTRNNNITYIPRAETNQTPTSILPTEDVSNLPTTVATPVLTTTTPTTIVQTKVTSTAKPTPTLSTKQSSTTISPTSSFRALLSRPPSPTNTPSPTLQPTAENVSATRTVHTPTKEIAQNTSTSTPIPTYLAYAITKEPTQLALATKVPTVTTQTKVIETKAPSAIPSTGIIENSLILFLAGSLFLMIGFLF